MARNHTAPATQQDLAALRDTLKAPKPSANNAKSKGEQQMPTIQELLPPAPQNPATPTATAGAPTELTVDGFDLQELFKLDAGDMIELPPLMPVLSPEPVMAQVMVRTDTDVTVFFSYYGATIGKSTLNKETLQWN